MRGSCYVVWNMLVDGQDFVARIDTETAAATTTKMKNRIPKLHRNIDQKYESHLEWNQMRLSSQQ